MTDTPDPATEEEEQPKKKSKAMLFGLIGAVLLGGGAFFGVYSGMIPLPFGEEKPKEEQAYSEEPTEEEDAFKNPATAEAAFVPMEEMVISLGPDSRAKHLKVAVSIEVEPGAEEGVMKVSPRIADVLNTYLRAVDESDLESPRAMMRMRAQMLRRVQLVSPPGTVRDVLIQQFVLN